MDVAAYQTPPDPPELPDGAAPRWPAWYAGVGLLVALTATLVAGGILFVITGADDEDPTFTILATLLQSAIFIGTAVFFASLTRDPKPWHFGLRRTRLWPAVGWAVLALVSFYLIAAIYSEIVQPDADQTVAEDLGSDQGTFGLIAAGFMIVCVAPAAEEFFFRGFLYRALRTRFPVLAAAGINGLLFGSIHFTGGDTALILPVLGLLGFTFCLVYEKTGSIYPVIAMHSVNNSIAFGAQADGWEVSAVLGPLMLLACVLVPRVSAPAPALR